MTTNRFPASEAPLSVRGDPRPPSGLAGGDDFADVVRVTVDGIMVIDAQGIVRFANPAAASVLGRDLGALHDVSFGLPITGGGDLAQLDVVRPDGSSVVVEMHVAPMRWREMDVKVVTLRDTTDRVTAERRLARSEERFALSAKGANDGLWDWSSESGRVYLSARLQDMLGDEAHDREEDPQRLSARVHIEDAEPLRHELERHLAGDVPQFQHEFRVRRRDGSWLWVMARGMAVRDEGRVRRFAGSLTDISERKRAEASLWRLALHDALTGLFNRAVFLDHLQGAIERHRRANVSFAVLFFDLDRFKLVNDSLGHEVGDAVLIEVGQRLERCVRATDTVARLGGDEFAVLLDAPEALDSVLETVQRIQQAIAEPVRVGSHGVYTTASIGVARSEDIPTDPETALRYADIAMYEAKGAGRNTFEVFAASMHAQAASQLRLHNDLRRAARRNQFFLRYQPIVDLDDGRITGFEALLRWRVSSGSVLDAAEFIDAAEETGVIVDATSDLLADACRQVSDWRSAGLAVGVTVNVSERQFVDGDLADEVAAVLRDLGLDGGALGLEITERTATVPAGGSLRQLESLRALGVGLLVDDFGTGYSSLAAIHELPLTAVKIDKGFVNGLDHDSTGDLVAAIIAIARSLHLDVVAEGIETPAQRDRLRALGCTRGQGYLFGRALDGDRATQLLLEQANTPPTRPHRGDERWS